MMQKKEPIIYKEDTLFLLDQRKLPLEEVYVECKNLEQTHNAINVMVTRGAPCIGFTAIFGMALYVKNNLDFSLASFKEAAEYLKSARPTAVNLAFEVDKLVETITRDKLTSTDCYNKIVEIGHRELKKSEERNRAMANNVIEHLTKTTGDRKLRVLTHCNTGYLACGSIGTALGVIQVLSEKKLIEKVWVDETRPYLQGSRLTAYELNNLGIEHNVVVEGAASYLMKNNLVDAIFVGADRIVANGDTANKVGTSNLSILAKHYNIPFYVVAPSSSFDLSISSGEKIEIEMRPEEEILEYKDLRIAPKTSQALNPSFDISDGQLITGIASELGIATENYIETLKGIVE